MKKTLLALAVMAAAGSAQAGIEVYNNEGVTVNLKGDIEVVYVQAIAENSEFKQEIQDADFGFDVRYAINDDLQFGGYWEFDGASSDVTKGSSTSANVGDVYVALYSQSMGSIKVGRTCGMLDDAGVANDYQFGITSFFSNDSEFCGDETIRYDIDKGNIYAGASYTQDKNENTNIGKDGNYFDAKIGGRVAGFDIRAYFASASLENRADNAANADETLWALEAVYSGVENLNVGIGYYALNQDVQGAGDMDSDSLALGVDYTIEKTTLSVGYSLSDKDGAADKINSWFVNAGYGLAPNTTAYVEVGGNDVDNTDTGVALGVKASF
ncbi:porin [Vibrio aestuarianus]|uniref:porin n=1 Tax=Vibrio aestuarianus TaxID=28171 RepID=UPI00237C8763|nr:porin [Vibrio aestuarianus]MDE1231895.1 porin [Vibrio aestuarianus]MDE1337341.1 porin [Vibrio aestuarianus]